MLPFFSSQWSTDSIDHVTLISRALRFCTRIFLEFLWKFLGKKENQKRNATFTSVSLCILCFMGYCMWYFGAFQLHRHVTTSRVGLASGQYVILAKVNRTEIMITTWFLKLKVALGLAWSDVMILLYRIRVRDKKGICFLAFYNWESNKDFWNEFFTVFYLINWANVNLVTIFWFVWFQTNLKRYHLFIFHRLTVRQVLALIRN